MAARVPELAADRNLRLLDAIYLNEPDVSLDGERVDIDEAIELAKLTAAPFASIDMDEFDSVELLAQVNENIPENSPAVEHLKRLIGSAAKYNGMNERLWLRWAAHGLNYEWSATADWRRELAVDMARATFEGQQESAAQAQARDSAIDSLVALLMNSPEFRAAMPTKRIPTALALLASQQNANEDAIRQAASRASTNLARRVLEIEILLKPRLDELAEELRHTPDWRVATSIPKRHEAAVTFLMEKAEGFRLSSGISDPLMRAAKQLEDSTASRKDTWRP